jgi:pyruvate formate lyase activating enzyme
MMKKETLLYKQLPGDRVQCQICQRRCTIPEGRSGWCLTRVNEKGVLFSLLYGEVSSLSINPIEKKPVFHFHPGSRWLSLGSWGCNFRCSVCQNWEIAHWKGKHLESTHHLSPADQVEMALQQGCLGLSWTFNEPTLWFEYTFDTAKLAKEKGLQTNYVTNGYITDEALDMMTPYLDVYRVDIKGFSSKTYWRLAQVDDFQGILRVTQRARDQGMHVEVVTNVIPGVNDDDGQLKGIASWIRESLGENTPWHVTRFYPYVELSDPMATQVSTLEHARELGIDAGLRYVYVGNVPGHRHENTYCHECGIQLIKRSVFDILENRIEQGRCPECGEQIPGRF